MALLSSWFSLRYTVSAKIKEIGGLGDCSIWAPVHACLHHFRFRGLGVQGFRVQGLGVEAGKVKLLSSADIQSLCARRGEPELPSATT